MRTYTGCINSPQVPKTIDDYLKNYYTQKVTPLSLRFDFKSCAVSGTGRLIPRTGLYFSPKIFYLFKMKINLPKILIL